LARWQAELEAHPEIALVYGDYQLFGSSDRLMKTGNFNTYRILFANYLPVCSMYRRTAWEDVGGYTEAMKGFEDWEFWIKLVEKDYTFRKINEVLYYHHVHEDNMWLRDKGKWRSLVAQIRQLHPRLYSREHLAQQHRENRITWLEDIIYRLPPPTRYALRERLSPLISVARKIGLYRDY
jgi:cellulose synthase/poly-beta-1,6-N-acetylglucosamine synthase-like glycosyltransferase